MQKNLPPFPIDALPAPLQQVAVAVHELTQAPVPIIASSLLAALAMAAQKHYRLQHLDNRLTKPSLFMIHIDDTGAAKAEVSRRVFAGIRQAEHDINTLLQNRHRAKQPSNPTAAQNKSEPDPLPVLSMVYTNALDEGLHKRSDQTAVIDTEADPIFSDEGLRMLHSLCSDWDSLDLMESRDYSLAKNRPPTSSPITLLGYKAPNAVIWGKKNTTACLSVRSEALAKHIENQPQSASTYGFFERSLFTPATAQASIPECKIETLADRLMILDRFTAITYRMLTQPVAKRFRTDDIPPQERAQLEQLGKDIRDFGNLFLGLNAYLSQLQNNAWRISLLLHCYQYMAEQNTLGENDLLLSAESVRSARALMDWYLQSYLHLFSPAIKNPNAIEADTEKLERWLGTKIEESQQKKVAGVSLQVDGSWTFEQSAVLRAGPFRKENAAERLERAIERLQQRGKLQRSASPPGAKKMLKVRPGPGQTLQLVTS